MPGTLYDQDKHLGNVGYVGEGDAWRDAFARMSDAELDEFAAELTETLPAGDPMIAEVRYWLRRLRDEARREG